jgi:predicted transcriptional regulator
MAVVNESMVSVLAMMSEPFEETVLLRCEHAIDELDGMLAEFGVKAICRGLREAGAGRHTSEIEVRIYRDNQLLDSIDFFVIRNGEEVGTIDEIDAWLRAELEAIPGRHNLRHINDAWRLPSD